MDFNQIWEEHKAFIIKVAVAFLVFLVASAYMEGIRSEAATYEAENVELQSQIDALVADLAGSEGRQRGLADALEGTTEPQVRLLVEMEIPDTYRVELASEQARSTFYIERLSDLARVLAQATHRGMQPPPRLGLPESVAAADVAIASIRAHVAGAIARALLDADIPRILSVRPATAPAYEPLDEERSLRRIGFDVEVRAPFDAIPRLLSALQDRGSFLEVRSATLTREPSEPLYRLALGLAAINVVPRAEAQQAGMPEAQGNGPTGQPPAWRPFSGGRRR